MLFYTTFVFQLIYAVLCIVDLNDLSTENTQKLGHAITTFLVKTEVKVSNDGRNINVNEKKNFGNESDDLNPSHVYENLKNSFLIIFKQMSNFHHSFLHTVKNECSESCSLNYDHFESKYVEVVCQYTIRGLDFIIFFKINDAIQINYKADFLWTKYDWLSGKYFFLKNHNSLDMEKLKERIIFIDGQPINLFEIYYYFLPFHQNMKTVLFFHNMFVYMLVRMMNTYVYRHAKIIMCLIEKINMNDKAYENMAASVKWYEDGSVIFYKYLFTRAVVFKHSTLFDTIIKNIKDINNLNYPELTYNVSNILEEDILDWAKIDSLSSSDISVDNLFDKLLTNCKDAISYIIDFISIVKEYDVADTISIEENYQSNALKVCYLKI